MLHACGVLQPKFQILLEQVPRGSCPPVFVWADEEACEVQTTVYRHWTEEHSRMRLDGPMLDRIVGLAVNPYYCHNAAQDVP